MPLLSFLQLKTLKVLLIFFVHIKAFAHFVVNKTTSRNAHFCRNFYAFKTLLAVFDKFHVCTYTYSQLATLIIAVL